MPPHNSACPGHRFLLALVAGAAGVATLRGSDGLENSIEIARTIETDGAFDIGFTIPFFNDNIFSTSRLSRIGWAESAESVVEHDRQEHDVSDDHCHGIRSRCERGS
jgi:hypothetical protein